MIAATPTIRGTSARRPRLFGSFMVGLDKSDRDRRPRLAMHPTAAERVSLKPNDPAQQPGPPSAIVPRRTVSGPGRLQRLDTVHGLVGMGEARPRRGMGSPRQPPRVPTRCGIGPHPTQGDHDALRRPTATILRATPAV